MGCTQPVKLDLESLRFNPFAEPNYSPEVRPLLQSMVGTFSGLARRMEALSPSGAGTLLWEEIVDSTKMNALRSIELLSLYEYVNGWLVESDSWRQEQLQR